MPQPIVLAGTDKGLFEPGSDRPARFEGRKVSGIVTAGATWWTIVDDREIWESTGGAVEKVAAVERRRANCLLPVDGDLLVGTSGAHLLRLRAGALQPVAGFEAAEGRSTWYTPWGGPPDTRSLSRGARGPLYANVHVGGVLRSEDADRWLPTMDIDADVHQVTAHPTQADVVFAASARGLGISHDAGGTWDFQTAGLHGDYCRAVDVADGTVFVTASTGQASRRGALYRRAFDSDGSFEKCRDGLPGWFPANIDTLCVAANGKIVVFGTEEGAVFASDDLGEHWWTVARDLPPVRAIALVAPA